MFLMRKDLKDPGYIPNFAPKPEEWSFSLTSMLWKWSESKENLVWYHVFSGKEWNKNVLNNTIRFQK